MATNIRVNVLNWTCWEKVTTRKARGISKEREKVIQSFMDNVINVVNGVIQQGVRQNQRTRVMDMEKTIVCEMACQGIWHTNAKKERGKVQLGSAKTIFRKLERRSSSQRRLASLGQSSGSSLD